MTLSPDKLLRLAYASADDGDLEKAIELATKAIECDRDLSSPDPLLIRGFFHESSKHPEKALLDFREATKLFPQSVQASEALFQCLVGFGEMGQASVELDRFCASISAELRRTPDVLDYLRLRAKFKACDPESINAVREHFRSIARTRQGS